MQSYEALERIAAIYHLDHELFDLTPEERLEKRKLRIAPLVEEYFAWVKKVSQTSIYSITETAKLNGMNPFRYLEYVLTELVAHQDETDRSFLENLMPWSKTLPEICKVKK